jgi:hypothetical protein
MALKRGCANCIRPQTGKGLGRIDAAGLCFFMLRICRPARQCQLVNPPPRDKKKIHRQREGGGRGQQVKQNARYSISCPITDMCKATKRCNCRGTQMELLRSIYAHRSIQEHRALWSSCTAAAVMLTQSASIRSDGMARAR